MMDGSSQYGFGAGLSMITDIFQKNKIHVIGGELSSQKYGYFQFDNHVLSNADAGKIFFYFYFFALNFFSLPFA